MQDDVHNEVCNCGVARMAIRTGDIRRLDTFNIHIICACTGHLHKLLAIPNATFVYLYLYVITTEIKTAHYVFRMYMYCTCLCISSVFNVNVHLTML